MIQNKLGCTAMREAFGFALQDSNLLVQVNDDKALGDSESGNAISVLSAAIHDSDGFDIDHTWCLPLPSTGRISPRSGSTSLVASPGFGHQSPGSSALKPQWVINCPKFVSAETAQTCSQQELGCCQRLHSAPPQLEPRLQTEDGRTREMYAREISSCHRLKGVESAKPVAKHAVQREAEVCKQYLNGDECCQIQRQRRHYLANPTKAGNFGRQIRAATNDKHTESASLQNVKLPTLLLPSNKENHGLQTPRAGCKQRFRAGSNRRKPHDLL